MTAAHDGPFDGTRWEPGSRCPAPALFMEASPGVLSLHFRAFGGMRMAQNSLTGTCGGQKTTFFVIFPLTLG